MGVRHVLWYDAGGLRRRRGVGVRVRVRVRVRVGIRVGARAGVRATATATNTARQGFGAARTTLQDNTSG